MVSDKELSTRFDYHVPNDNQIEKYKVIRATAFDLAKVITNLCPESREKSLALTYIEQSVMWANAAIARRE